VQPLLNRNLAAYRRALVAPLLLVCIVVVGFSLVGLMQHLAAMEPDGLLGTIVARGSLDHYFGSLFGLIAQQGFWGWMFNYAPLSLVVGLVVVFIGLGIYRIVWPERDILFLSSIMFDLIHRGVDMPPINHLKHIMRVCPNPDAQTLQEDLYRGGVRPEAPASQVSEIVDEPLTGYGRQSKRKRAQNRAKAL
jgi:hypothetical protein